MLVAVVVGRNGMMGTPVDGNVVLGLRSKSRESTARKGEDEAAEGHKRGRHHWRVRTEKDSNLAMSRR